MLINCFNIKPPTVDMSAVRRLERSKLYYFPFLRNKIAWKIWHAKGTNSIEWRTIIHHPHITFLEYWASRAGWIWGRAVCQHVLSSLNVNLPQVLTSTPPHTAFPLLCSSAGPAGTDTDWDGVAQLVAHCTPPPPQSCCLRQSVMHSCNIETGWKQNNGQFYRGKKQNAGLKVLRKEDEEKNLFPVATRRANGLALSLQFIVNELVQHGKKNCGLNWNADTWRSDDVRSACATAAH